MIFELFHHAALIPLILLAVAAHRRREAPPVVYWLVAAGLAVSWVADSYVELAGTNPWWVSYVYPPIQAGLIFWGVTRLETSEATRMSVAAALAVVALASMASGPMDRPEAVAQGLAAVVVVVAIRRHHELGLLRYGLLVYFGLGLGWWVLWPLTFGGPHFVTVYYGYQMTRMAGLALASVAMWQYRRHLLTLP